ASAAARRRSCGITSRKSWGCRTRLFIPRGVVRFVKKASKTCPFEAGGLVFCRLGTVTRGHPAPRAAHGPPIPPRSRPPRARSRARVGVRRVVRAVPRGDGGDRAAFCLPFAVGARAHRSVRRRRREEANGARRPTPDRAPAVA